MDLLRLRAAILANLGQTLTPDVAAQLEQAAAFYEDRTIDPGQFEPKVYQGKVVFRAERFVDVAPELHALHVAHYAETEAHRAGIPLNGDIERCVALERAGQVVQIVARVVDTGELVGNFRLYVVRSMHTQTLMAREDTFYIVPAWRQGFLGIRMWQYVEQCMRQLGVRELELDTKKVNGVDRMAVYLGYRAVATKFVKILEAPHVQQ